MWVGQRRPMHVREGQTWIASLDRCECPIGALAVCTVSDRSRLLDVQDGELFGKSARCWTLESHVMLPAGSETTTGGSSAARSSSRMPDRTTPWFSMQKVSTARYTFRPCGIQSMSWSDHNVSPRTIVLEPFVKGRRKGEPKPPLSQSKLRGIHAGRGSLLREPAFEKFARQGPPFVPTDGEVREKHGHNLRCMRRLFLLCSTCDRGQIYDSPPCRREARVTSRSASRGRYLAKGRPSQSFGSVTGRSPRETTPASGVSIGTSDVSAPRTIARASACVGQCPMTVARCTGGYVDGARFDEEDDAIEGTPEVRLAVFRDDDLEMKVDSAFTGVTCTVRLRRDGGARR